MSEEMTCPHCSGRHKKRSEEERKKYVEFMYNPENEYNCDECPENKDFDDWEGKYPCGQQNCWVTCHCREIME